MLLEEQDHLFSTSSSSSSNDRASSEFDSTDSSADRNSEVERRKNVRLKNFIEAAVVRYDVYEFREHFRMSRETADFLIGKIATAGVLPTHYYGREKISSKKACLMSLWYLSNNETFRQVSDRFNVAKSSAHRIIKKIVEFLVSLSSEYIKWPTGETALEVVKGFHEKRKIFGVIGAIDCSHIRIKRPLHDQEAYYNRKGYHSILLQAVCDHRKRFTYIFCGEAGSLHDARCLRKSSIFEKCENNQLPIENYFLLGDSAYPVLPWLIPPFKDNGNLTHNHHLFNYRHSATRIVIENSFALLKGRFRKLLHIFENMDIEFIVLCIVGACVLHNICINHDDLDINIENYDAIDDSDNSSTHEYTVDMNGISKRDEIYNQMFG